MAANKQPASVAVVIPCLNVEATIGATIDSAKSQAGIDLEIICIDDGSRDSTHQLLSKWASESVIKYLNTIPACGASGSRNRGLKATRNDFIQFLDADDILLPGKLLRQASIIQDCGADLVVGAYEFKRFDGITTLHYPDKDYWRGLIGSRMGRTSSILFRSKSLKRIGGWARNQQSSQEYELMFRLLKNGGRISFDDVIGTRINATADSISNRNIEANATRFIQLRKQILDHLKQINKLTAAQQHQYGEIYKRTMIELEKTKRPKFFATDSIHE